MGVFVIFALGILFYMTFNIGVFRLNRGDYNHYTVYFEDVSGLQKKAEVKIAGVKVGWVESIDLLQDGVLQAKALITVLKVYELHTDAYAIVRQDGILGAKYLEIVPGDSLLPALGSGQALGKPGRPPVNVDELFQKFKVIANNVEDITNSIKNVVGSDGTDNLRSIITNFNTASSHLSAFSDSLERTISSNEQNLNSMISDFKDFAKEIRTGWPNLQSSIEKMSNVIDRDLNRFATKFESTAGAVEDAAVQARDGLRSISDVADKINEGRGLLGKLVTEDETYSDIKVAVQGLKNYFAKVERLGIVFDAHSESMWGKAENFTDHLDLNVTKKDSRGYFGVRIHPSDDRYYILQAVSGRKGWVERYTTHQRFSGATGELTDMCSNGPMTEIQPTFTRVKIQDPECKETTIQHRDGKLKFNLQMAKAFKDLAFRFGLFESSAGMAIDYDIPFGTENFRWVTSIEAYDFYGDDRIADQRPHLKWLNSVFMFNNLYMAFGADDFISKRNANAFFGMGLRFGDDDMKYLVSKVGAPNF